MEVATATEITELGSLLTIGIIVVTMVVQYLIAGHLERNELLKAKWLARITEAMPTLVKAMSTFGLTMKEAADAFKGLGDAIQAEFTLAEIREARAAGIPLLDYWAYWEAKGYKSPRWKASS